MTNDGVPAIGMCAKVALGKLFIQRATDNAWNGLLRIADLTGLVNVFVSETNFRNRNRFRYGIGFFVVCFANLAPILRRIVFIGETALSLGTALVMVCYGFCAVRARGA